MKKVTQLLLAFALVGLSLLPTAATAATKDTDTATNPQPEQQLEADFNLLYENPFPYVEAEAPYWMPLSKVNIKVLDTDGKIQMEKALYLEDFLDTHKRQDLVPEKAYLLMYFEGTAYYVLSE
jgi:hypothetical protein